MRIVRTPASTASPTPRGEECSLRRNHRDGRNGLHEGLAGGRLSRKKVELSFSHINKVLMTGGCVEEASVF